MFLDLVLFIFVILYDCLVIYVLIMLISTVGSHRPKSYKDPGRAKAYCGCWSQRAPISWKQLSFCSCGEDNDIREWKWENPSDAAPRSVVLSEEAKQVTFHPVYSSGTAVVKGETPLQHNYHYYWEVKMLTETYGTDIMVGVGTSKVDVSGSQYKFTSLLGQDAESYGLSYTGVVRHDAMAERHATGFCRGSIVGVRVDMWRGTLEFYLNRQPQGVSFYNLRRHPQLFPMLCSTAAQSSLRLVYAASWPASLLVDAARTLAARPTARPRLPPGLWHTLRKQFWLTLPSEGCAPDEAESDDSMESAPARRPRPDSAQSDVPAPSSAYVNGFYVDSVAPDYRLVVWQ